MDSLLRDPCERARNYQTLVLQALSGNGKAAALSVTLGVSEASISRLKNEHLDLFCKVLAHLNLKVVDGHKRCVDERDYYALYRLAGKFFDEDLKTRKLIWEDEI